MASDEGGDDASLPDAAEAPIRAQSGKSGTAADATGQPGRSWRGITDLADVKYLRRIWTREISKQLRDLKFSSHNFVIDPLQGAIVARNLDDFIGQLSRDLLAGSYSPRRGVILRSAKKLGISRPVCVLQPRDALVYRAIVSLAERELLRGVPSWVAFQRQDKGAKQNADDDLESVDWFERWIRHEGMLPNILHRDDIEYVVQSDISNFFPSVRQEVIREHLSNNTTLDRTLVRLCCQIISAVLPRVDYADDSFLGLPQEAQNTSRVIAQAILKPVDDEFTDLGNDGRYSRFMDDAIWGARTIEEAHTILARFQVCLEAVGLYPNGSKTKVMRKTEFVHAYMVAVNAELEQIDNRMDPLFKHGRKVEVTPVDLIHDIREISNSHRAADPRPERWSRVTRRLYTIHRRLGINDWRDHWSEDLVQDPAGAATYFEYFRSRQLRIDDLETAKNAVREFFNLYSDVEFMFAESVSTAPVENDSDLWSKIYEFCSLEFSSSAKGVSQNANTATAWFVAAAKFGNSGQRKTLVENAIKWCAHTMPNVVIQCAALDASVSLPRAIPSNLYGTDEVLASEFLQKLDAGDARTIGVVQSQLAATSALAPVRALVRPRSLLLLERLGSIGKADAKQIRATISSLSSNPDRLRDHRTEHLLSNWS